MTITRENTLLRLVGVLLLFISTSLALAEKIKLLCNVDVVKDYPSGNTSNRREQIQVDIESIKDRLFIHSTGIDIGFAMSNAPSGSTGNNINSSDENVFDLHITRAAKPDGEGESEHLRIDRTSGLLYYRSVGKMTRTATGVCSKLDQKKRAF